MTSDEEKEITDYGWIDLERGSVSFAISERVTITLQLEEVMDFLNIVTVVTETLKSVDGVTLGTYDHEGETYEQFMLTPEESDFN